LAEKPDCSICKTLKGDSFDWADCIICIPNQMEENVDAEKIYENALEVLQTISKLKPSAAKGTYFKSIHISSTMSPGIEIETKSVAGI
jgi:hypothetical protein